MSQCPKVPVVYSKVLKGSQMCCRTSRSTVKIIRGSVRCVNDFTMKFTFIDGDDLYNSESSLVIFSLEKDPSTVAEVAGIVA